jgi:uncharacterized protein YqjF (DUF2071 family)
MTAFLRARWRHVVIASYAVEEAAVTPFLPAGVELDRWQGWPVVSLLALEMTDVRVRGVPIPLHRRFPDVNFRCYARRADGEPGVVFLKEIVPRRAVALVARLVFNEKFVARSVRHAVEREGDASRFLYVWRDGGRTHRLAATVAGPPQVIQAGSLEEFLMERRLGFVAQRDGRLLTYRIERERWRWWRPLAFETQADAAILYGERFRGLFETPPISVVVAEGSPVTVRKARA